MKSLFLTFIIAFSAVHAQAAEKKYGIGFILGDPTALSGKYNMSHEHAIDLQLAFNASDFLLVYGDYHWKFPGIFNSSDKFIQELTPYMGAGPVVAIASKKDHKKGDYFDKRNDSFAMGVRLPFGIEWVWDKVPLGIGLEIAPGIVVVPSTDGFLHGGVTFRYYF